MNESMWVEEEDGSLSCPRDWCRSIISGGDSRCPRCGFPDRETVTYIQNWIRELETESFKRKYMNAVDHRALAWRIKILKTTLGWWEDLELEKEARRNEKTTP